MLRKQDFESNDSELTREDLFLLLESYRNNIELNTTLLEKINSIIEGNKNNSEMIQKFLQSLLEVTKSISEAKDIQEKLFNEHMIKMEKQHGTIKQNLYLLYIGIGAILIPLIKMMIDAIDNHQKMLDIIQKISKILGSG